MKNIEGKTPMHLIPAEAIEDLAWAMHHGAKKYAINDWRKGKGMPWTWLIASILRHSWALMRGENYDAESSLHHGAHVMAAAAMLCYYTRYKRYHPMDDRFNWDKED